MKHLVPPEAQGSRLDVFAARITGLSRSAMKTAILGGNITVDGQVAPPNLRLKAGQHLNYLKPLDHASSPRTAPTIDILYQDDQLLVINKPAGLTVHPGAGSHDDGYVSDFAALHTSDSQADRPGIVHRLDKDTSGVMLIARTQASRQYLQTLFNQRRITKTYLALVHGRPQSNDAIIDLPLGRDPHHSLRQAVVPGGRPAQTEYRLLTAFHHYSLLEVHPQTGRTHQIRVHLAALGHSIVGDVTYGQAGRPTGLTRQFLHASAISFQAPDGHHVEVRSPLPPELEAFLNTLQT